VLRSSFGGLSRALVPRKIDPLFQAEQLSLPVGEVLVQAMLRAKLLMRKSVADKAEPAIARRAVDRCLSDIGISIFAHRRDSLIRLPGGMREDYLRWCPGAMVVSKSNYYFVHQPYSLSLASLPWSAIALP